MMEDKKKEDATKKLEQQFNDFQKQWKKFLTNDFAHLSADVHKLVEQNATMQQNMKSMEKNIIKALGAQAHDWQQPPKKSS